MAQLQNELAEKEMVKKFRHDNTWMQELTAKNNWVGNDVIKIPRQGTDPVVLINNTVYPINTYNHADDFIPVSLNKYETENESVTDDELYALPYEKLSETQLKHRETLEESCGAHSLFSISIPKHTTNTPVLETTGENDGTGRKRLITQDLINLAVKLSALKVPLQGRVIVLSAEHAGDLMSEDSNRAKSWGGDFQNGAQGIMHVGFKLYVATYSPRYAKQADASDSNTVKWMRQGYEAITGRMASICFYKRNAIKATGSVKRYAIDAASNPSRRQNELGFRIYAIAVGIKDEGFAAIVSADAA
ncbi:hypothetical protein D3C72_344430 [compost metagenome]